MNITDEDLNVRATPVIECVNSIARTKPRGSLEVVQRFGEQFMETKAMDTALP
jgi:hypothetical protein